MRSYILILCFIFVITSCKQHENNFVKVKDGKILTSSNQELFLRGINVVNKNKNENFVPHFTSEVYETIKQQGFNCIRLGINWSALEPQPLSYNQEYLNKLDKQISLIAEQGMYIVLDIHQDLYGIKFGNGAPIWATLDEGHEHTTGEIWSDAYYESKAVQTAFDNFWNNKVVKESGIGIQEHYALMWQLIAKRYANQKYIIGYDLMNEPFIGSLAPMALLEMFKKMSEIDSTFSLEDIISKWDSPSEKVNILEKLSDINVYKEIMSAPENIYQQYEITKLQPFYQRLADSIRKVDTNHILFIEPSVSANNGVLSVIAPTKLKNGETDSQIVFAPHLYDIVLDTDLAFTADKNRLHFILSQLKASAAKFNMPIWIGEWGAFYDCDNCDSAAYIMTQMFENNIVSNVYWDYQNSLWEQSHFLKMQTTYPQKINGNLISYTNSENNTVITWEQLEHNKAETIIFIPDTDKVQTIEINNKAKNELQKFENSTNGLLYIYPYNNLDQQCQVTITYK